MASGLMKCILTQPMIAVLLTYESKSLSAPCTAGNMYSMTPLKRRLHRLRSASPRIFWSEFWQSFRKVFMAIMARSGLRSA